MHTLPLIVLALAGPAVPALAAVAATPPPINTEFNGDPTTPTGANATDAVYADPVGPYDTEFVGTGPAISALGLPGARFSPLGPDPLFISDTITLHYNDFLDELLHGQLPAGESGGALTFTGTDVLTAPDGGTLNISLAGTVFTTGTATMENLTFTDPGATVTGGTGSLAGLSGTVPFVGSLFGQDEAATVPATVAAPRTPTPQPIFAIYDAQYRDLTPTVPEPTPTALIALGFLPIGIAVARRRRIG